jgi:two-component system sensor histidine kinase DegS
MESFFAQPVARSMGAGLPLAARRRNGEVFFADISLAPIQSVAHGTLALVMVRDVSEQRRERLIAAQYLITQALAANETVEAAAGAVLEAIGPAAGASVAALWVVDDDSAVCFVDSWCATKRERPFHTESVDAVFRPGVGIIGDLAIDPRLHWSNDVITNPRFHRKHLAQRLGLHAGVWIRITERQDHLLGVLELLFGVIRDPDPGMVRILESFAAQLAQYLAFRRSEADRQRVLAQIVRSVEDERQRIAADLHDDIVQVQVATLISIDRLGKVIDADHTHAQDLLTTVRETLSAATDRTRHLIFDLRPQVLEAEGVMPAIAEVAILAGREAGFDVEVTQSTERFDPAVEALLYQVMKEAVTNARKHSHARHLRCSMRSTTRRVIGQVIDDGVGFQLDDTLDRARQQLSFGLSAIIELVRLADGHIDVETTPGAGTAVNISLPRHLTANGIARTLRTSRAASQSPPPTVTGRGRQKIGSKPTALP